MENCKDPSSHIAKEITNPQLQEIDDIYSAASVLSAQNAKKYNKTLLALSVGGALITLVFLVYDIFSYYLIIILCGLLILYLYAIHRVANKLDYHDKYLEYRVLAESLRVQYYIKSAGLKEDVLDLLPWSIKRSVPWIIDVLLTLPENYYNEKESILDLWVLDQMKYHESAYVKTEKQYHKNEIITKTALIITVIVYIATISFELAVYFNMIGDVGLFDLRMYLKFAMGMMSVITIFAESYYGKLSLDNKINDHKRMIELYRVTEKDISIHGESERIVRDLARDFLNENSTWYAYQSKNKPGIVI